MDAYEAPLEPLEPVKKPRGCFFYGCVIASVLTLLLLIALGIGGFMVYRGITAFIEQNTSTTPMPLPHVELPPEQMEDLDKRWETFFKDAGTDKDVPPLVLTADEINAKIAQNAELKDHVHVELPGDRIAGQISIPLEKTGFPGTKGRYLNGKASFRVELVNGTLFVFLESLEVNGKPISEDALKSFRSQNLAADVANKPENAREIEKLESIEVKDGKLILKARKKRTEDQEKTPDAEKPKADARDDKAKAEDKPAADTEKPKADGGEDKAKAEDKPATKADEKAEEKTPAEVK